LKRERYALLKLASLLVITYVFAKFQGGFVSWFLFYGCVTLAVYEGLTYILMFPGMTVSRVIDRDRLTDGEDLEVQLIIRRRFWFPLGWNLVVEPLPDKLAGYYEPHKQLVFPWFKRELVVRYAIPSLPRGSYQLTDCVVTAGDFFGFIQRSKSFPLYNSFLVYPSYRELTHWSTGDGKISGNIQVTHRRSDDVAAVRGIREYHRGDRLSQIHWRASARGTGLKTKEFEHQALNQVVFFFDTEKQSYASKDPQLFEMAVKLTASLVYYTHRRQFPFGFICHQHERIAIPPGSTHSHFFRVFDQLARVNPEGHLPFEKMIGREVLELTPGLTIVVITPNLDRKVVTQLMETARQGRNIHLFYVHENATLRSEELQALRMLAGSKITCKSVHLREYDELKRIGGA
jgi:uncharacterized protein (DUF58 family)